MALLKLDQPDVEFLHGWLQDLKNYAGGDQPRLRSLRQRVEALLKPQQVLLLTIEGGVLQDVDFPDWWPDGAEVELHDYDTDGDDGDNTREDNEGETYRLAVFVKR